jgi:hypothetical protein
VITARLVRGVREAPWRFRARIVVEAPAAYVRDRVPGQTEVRALGGDRCEFEPGSDNPAALAAYLGLLGADFTVVDAPELAEALRTLARRFDRAAGGPRR